MESLYNMKFKTQKAYSLKVRTILPSAFSPQNLAGFLLIEQNFKSGGGTSGFGLGS